MKDEDLKRLREPAQPDAWRDEKPTPQQIRFITTLIQDRIVPNNWLARIDYLSLHEEELTKGKASDIIVALKGLPLRSKQDRSRHQPRPEDVPAGRYAIQTGKEPNDLTFYRVWRGTANPNIVRIYIQAGPNEYQAKGQTADILKNIYRAGTEQAAIRYGKELGRCSACGLPLTNRLSRELGIGPICGGRTISNWDERVQKARIKLLKQGLDPEQSIDTTEKVAQ